MNQTENRTDENPLDARIRSALLDLDARVAEHVGPVRAPAPRERRRPWVPLLLPVGAGLAVVIVVGVLAAVLRPMDVTSTPAPPASQSASPSVSPSVSPSPSASASPSRSLATGPSQTRAEAARDHVPAVLADRPLSERLVPVVATSRTPTSAAGSGGLWVISRPDVAALDTEKVPAGYSEILHLSADGTKLIRAYPFPDIAPEWVVATPDALICGTVQNAGYGSTAALLCRIDLRTGAVTGKLVPCSPVGCLSMTEGNGVTGPGKWTTDDTVLTLEAFDEARLDGGDVLLTTRAGKILARVDPSTLAVRSK